MFLDGLDDLDQKIIRCLIQNARMPYSEIGQQVGISRVAVKMRVQALEKKGIIEEYTTIINPQKISGAISCYFEIETVPDTLEEVISILEKNDTVTQIYAEKFADEVDRLSDGKMKINVYPNSVLGGDRELLESCKDGDIPFVVQNTAPQVTFMKDTAVFDMPALFDNIDEVREHVDNPKFMKLMQQVYNDGG